MSQRKVGGGSKKSGFSALVIICFQKEQFPPELARKVVTQLFPLTPGSRGAPAFAVPICPSLP